MELVTKYGFIKKGIISVINDKIKYTETTHTKPLEKCPIVYAWVWVKGKKNLVIYVGETTKTIDKRIRDYNNSASKRAKEIRDKLNEYQNDGNIIVYVKPAEKVKMGKYNCTKYAHKVEESILIEIYKETLLNKVK